jgi:O-methyltransferase involved in polyketide biosynthesis
MAKQLDGWTREFLAAHPDATVLHLGCGLDSRVFRIDPPATVRWYDVDLPDVIELRRRLYPERHDYEMIAVSSVTDLHWLNGIPTDKPVFVVAEGLSGYLIPQEAFALFNRITGQFPSGQICFDIYSHFMAGEINLMVRVTSLWSKHTVGDRRVLLPWSMDDPRELGQQVARLRLLTAVPFLTMPEMTPFLIHSRVQGMIAGMLERQAWYRRAIQHLRYEF